MRKLSISVKRRLVMIIAALVSNGNLSGFATGTIYSGKLKQVCVPGLNCYSCPGAFGACPLGALQTMIADPRYKMSFYVIGFLAAFGMAAGRWLCGWICPFGFLQELLHMPAKFFAKIAAKRRKASAIPQRKRRKASAIPRRKLRAPFFLRYAKYVFLLVLVILLPIFLMDEFGYGAPYFCEWLCPSGTIMGALPLFLANSSLAAFIGPLFYIKISAAALIVAGALATNRFFCKYICPLGAIYGLFNRVALIRLIYDGEKCIDCGKCVKVCCMDIDPRKPGHRMECICCGECTKQCGQNALRIETPKTLFHNKQ